MIVFKMYKTHWSRLLADSSYLKKFSVAIINYESNTREEDQKKFKNAGGYRRRAA